ncbi:MAG: N-acetylmuramoyl-L-alanine amidase [Segetibacter sp.]
MRLISTVLLLVTLQGASQSTIGGSYLSRSVGKLTMLGSGLGEDRLGGAKFGYIDTSVLLQIVDSTKDMYLVRLSKSHTAYINKSDLKSDTSTKLRPFYLTNSWSVKGDEQYDYVNISLEEKLPYKSWMEINPSKIYLDIYGVQSNTNWITQLRSVKEITNVYFNQLEDDVVRVCIELKHKQNWGYSINYNNKILSVRVRRQPPVLKVNKMMIAVDAGHGGSNTGASGITTKVLEKNFTIRFANELQKYLTRKGAAIIMTRTSDTNVNNVDRVLMLQDAMPDLLISLHLNSSGNTNVKGVSTYYKHIGFRPLTTSILHRMLQLNLNEFGNIGSFNFTLNAPTDFPNSLVEIAFLSNPEDEKKILNPRFHKAVAKKIYRGVKDWLKTVRKS